MSDPSPGVDLVVIGDGPAGSALAQACRRADLDVVLVGDDAPWGATYSTWIDELPHGAAPAVTSSGSDAPAARPTRLVDPAEVVSVSSDRVWAYGAREHALDRAYATLDNRRLCDALRRDLTHRRQRVSSVVPAPVGIGDGHVVEFANGGALRARVVVDATGWPGRFASRASGAATSPSPAWQTALGVVLPEPPACDLGRATFMDFRAVTAPDGGRSTIGPAGVTTFCYSLPMPDGWLVEETVLAARPAVEPIGLLARVAARLGRHPDRLLADAVRTEYVRIPLGGSLPDRQQPIVAFGAAAGYVHAATGFSIAASMRAAPRVADALAGVLAAGSGSGAVDVRPVHDAVWPSTLRRTRVLHDYGLDVLLELDDDDVRAFFDSFFELDDADWAAYLRIDTPPATVSAVMARLFRSSSWATRRRLAGRNPLGLARLLRP